MLLFPLAKILKLSISTGILQERAWALMLECGGEVRRAPVLKLLPAWSATLVWSVRMVEPTYTDTHCVQLNLYTRSRALQGDKKLVFVWEEFFGLITKIRQRSVTFLLILLILLLLIFGKKCYLSLLYFGYQSETLRIELSKLLSKYFSCIDFHIILVNNYKIWSLFSYKDKLPISLQSSRSGV